MQIYFFLSRDIDKRKNFNLNFWILDAKVWTWLSRVRGHADDIKSRFQRHRDIGNLVSFLRTSSYRKLPWMSRKSTTTWTNIPTCLWKFSSKSLFCSFSWLWNSVNERKVQRGHEISHFTIEQIPPPELNCLKFFKIGGWWKKTWEVDRIRRRKKYEMWASLKSRPQLLRTTGKQV